MCSGKTKKSLRRPGIKPGSRPWQGRILSLYYRRAPLSIPRLELGTSRVLGERHNQLDHTDWVGKTAAWSIWVSIPVPRPC